MREEKSALDKHRDDLMARLHGQHGEQRATLEVELAKLLSKLGSATQRLSLDRMPSYFQELLRKPETVVRLEPQQLRLDGWASCAARNDAIESKLIEFTDLLGRTGAAGP